MAAGTSAVVKTTPTKSRIPKVTDEQVRTAKFEAISTVTSFSVAKAVVGPGGNTAAHNAVAYYEAAALRALLTPEVALLENGNKELVVAFAVYHHKAAAIEVVKSHPEWLNLSGMKVVDTMAYPIRESTYPTIKEIIKARHKGVIPSRGFANLFGLLRQN